MKVHKLPSLVRTSLAIGVSAVLLSACGTGKWGFPYRADVQQGNWITEQQVAQLQVGMSREQVRYALGTPTLQDIFHADRWDYPYYNQPGYGKPEKRLFTVWFENDELVRWEGSEQPNHQPFQDPKQIEKAEREGITPYEAESRAIDSEPVAEPNPNVVNPHDAPTPF